MNYKEFLLNLLSKNEGKIIGGVIGLFIGILILSIGFLKALFIVLCVFLGYYIGKKKDNNENILEIIEKIIPSGWK